MAPACNSASVTVPTRIFSITVASLVSHTLASYLSTQLSPTGTASGGQLTREVLVLTLAITKFWLLSCHCNATSLPSWGNPLISQTPLKSLRNSPPKVVTVKVASANCTLLSNTLIVCCPSPAKYQFSSAMKPLLISPPQLFCVSPRLIP